MQNREICADIPKVSIIIPVFNGSNYLREAIDSALAQTYSNVEVLVVNDGSDDGGKTEKIALSYGDRIRYFKKENGGVASALNTGIRNMDGEYFSWLSHDDVYYPHKIEREVEAVLQCGDPARIVQCEYDFYEESSKTYTPTDFYKYYTIEQLTNSVFTVLQLQIHACGALISKKHFERVGLFDESRRYTQDVEMWFRLLNGQKSIWVSEKLYMVRVHSESDSKHYYNAWNQENVLLYLEIMQKMSNQELASIYGTAETALCRIIGLIRSRDGLEEAGILEKRLYECYRRSDHQEDIDCFKGYLRGLSGGQDKKIIIFGAGQYGLRLLYELRQRQIAVDCFIDNDPGKSGKIIGGIICRAVEDLTDRKEEVLIVIAQRVCTEAIRQMQVSGFPHIITRQELDGVLIQYAPQQ